MNANKYISKREHRLILITSFLAFIFPVSIFLLQIAQQYNESVADKQTEMKYRADGETPLRFSNCAITYSVPFLYFSSVLIFIALTGKRFILASFLTLFYILSIIYVIYRRFNNSFAESMFGKLNDEFFRQMQIAVGGFDYVVFAFTLILFFWQISILARILIKNTQRKNELP